MAREYCFLNSEQRAVAEELKQKGEIKDVDKVSKRQFEKIKKILKNRRDEASRKAIEVAREARKGRLHSGISRKIFNTPE